MNLKRLFPEPNECAHERPVVFHRFRIVVQAFDEEQAERIAEKISEFASCDIERVWAVTDQEAESVLGEAVIQRRNIQLKERTLSDG